MGIGPALLAALEVGAKIAPSVIAAMPSKAEKQAQAAYQNMLGYDPTKQLQKLLPGERQRILSATQQAKAQLGRGGLAGGQRNEALGKLYQATFGGLAKAEGQLRDQLMQQNLEKYKMATSGLAGIGQQRSDAKAQVADTMSKMDHRATAEGLYEAYSKERGKSGELGSNKTPKTGGGNK